MVYTASIVVPVFQTEEYLRECLQSLLDQTHQNFEIVIVDDFSPGDCQSIVDDFRHVRPNIKYVRHQKNLGLLLTRFTGAQHSSGDYVGYLDSDDKARTNFVEVLLMTANQTGADIVGSLANKTSKPAEFKLEGSRQLLEAYANNTIQNYNVWSKLYRRKLLLSLKELNRLAKKKRMDSPEDLLINVFCAFKEPTYVNVPHILVEYNRIRYDSLTNTNDDRGVIQDLQGRLDAYEILRNASGDFELLVENLIQRSSTYLYKRKMMQYSEESFEKASLYLAGKKGGPLVLSYMLKAADSNRRKIEGLKSKNQALKSKIENLQRVNSNLKTLRGTFKTILSELGFANKETRTIK